ncbi:30S ribosomal protein S4 [Chloroflexota bacterium]
MGRYAGSVCRLCRRSGDKLMLKGVKCFTKCTLDRRSQPPGQHIARRRRISDRGVQLREKQKARYTYGLMERQFRRLFGRAEKMSGITGDNLLVLLERRLDNVVFRLGFAESRSQARQLVTHGHIMLNGRKTDIASCMANENDTVSWNTRSIGTEYYKQVAGAIGSRSIPNWLSLDRQTLVGQIISMPMPDDVEIKIDRKAIVEYYSR